MSKQSSQISNQEWTAALMKLITTAYQFCLSPRTISLDRASRFLRIAGVLPKIRSRCMGYVAELSADLSRWKVLKKFGNWDERFEKRFEKHISKLTVDNGFLSVTGGRLVPELVSAPQAEDVLFVPRWEQSRLVHPDMRHTDFTVRSAIVVLIPLGREKAGFIFVGLPHYVSAVLQKICELRSNIIRSFSVEPIVLPQWYLNLIHNRLVREVEWLGEQFYSFDAKKGGGRLDVCPHSLRVACVGTMLAYALHFSLSDRLRSFTVFLLHDAGKSELDASTLQKLAFGRRLDLKTEVPELRRHAEYSAAYFLSRFSNRIQKEWMLPILCHHSPSKSELKVREPSVETCLEKLNFKNWHIYNQVRQNPPNRVIADAVEILRVADAIEDDAVQRYHRFQPKKVTRNLANLFKPEERKHFRTHILDALRQNERQIKEIYTMGWRLPSNVKSFRSFLVDPWKL